MPEYKNTLLNLNLKSLLKEYSGKNSLTLKKIFPDHYRLISEQLSVYPKALKKLPVFTSQGCFLTAKSYEQSSSESLANYKAGLFGGNGLLDLTGGLGIDDIAFSNSFDYVTSVDNDFALNELVRANLFKMGISNIRRIDSAAEEFIKGNITASLIYIDADRRSKGKRSVKLEDSSPRVLLLLNRLFEISPRVLLKLSPLTDITYLAKTLRNLSEIRVISFEGEVKEILVLIERDREGKTKIHAVELMPGKEEKVFSGTLLSAEKPDKSESGSFFYEPSAGLIKAGLTAQYALKNSLSVICSNGVYLNANTLKKNFFGRSFRIISKFDFGKSAVKQYLKQNGISKANVSRREFPVKVDELRKTFGILDGGDDYLFFTTGDNKKKLFFHCRKLQ